MCVYVCVCVHCGVFFVHFCVLFVVGGGGGVLLVNYCHVFCGHNLFEDASLRSTFVKEITVNFFLFYIFMLTVLCCLLC